jgi:Ca2+-binding RTX toxin-like protein
VRNKLALVAAVVFMAFPSSAVGATVEVDFGFFLNYVAAPGEVNDIEASEAGGTVTIVDSGAVIAAGQGCNQVSDHEVTCSGFEVRDFFLGDLGDSYTELAQESPRLEVIGSLGHDVLVVCPECRADLRGGPGADQLHGGRASTLMGDAGADTLTGGPDSDHIDAGGGSDTITAGAGGDKIAPGWGGDVVDGGAGVDRLEFRPRRKEGVVVDLRAGTATGQGTKTLVDVESVRGTFNPDELYGDEGHNRLSGEPGPDLLVGRGGQDVLLAGFGRISNNRLLGGAGSDELHDWLGDDRLVGGRGADLLIAKAGGNDRVLGRGGADVIRARDGFRDIVKGGRGGDSAGVDLGVDVTHSIETFF